MKLFWRGEHRKHFPPPRLLLLLPLDPLRPGFYFFIITVFIIAAAAAALPISFLL